jgi:hypothetical protein
MTPEMQEGYIPEYENEPQSIDVQRLHDEVAQRQLSDPYRRQEAIATFILSCQRMAYDLKQMCDARRCLSHPVDTLDGPAKYIEGKIEIEFRRIFGREL